MKTKIVITIAFCFWLYGMKHDRDGKGKKDHREIKKRKDTKAPEKRFIYDAYGDSVYLSSIRAHRINEIKANIDLNFAIKDNDFSPLIAASYDGFLDIVKKLIPLYTNQTAFSCALIAAAGQGHSEIVTLLLDNKADLHIHNDLPLALAAKNGKDKIVSLLVQLGAKPSLQAITWARKNNHNHIALYLEQLPKETL